MASRPKKIGRDCLPAYAYIRGPLRLVGRNGINLLPKGNLRKAIFAVLLLSGAKGISRSQLERMFWKEPGSKSAGASLRDALRALRDHFSFFDDDVIPKDADPIVFKSSRTIFADIAVDDQQEVLESLEAGLEDPERELSQWLDSKRILFNRDIPRLNHEPFPTVGLGILPIHFTQDTAAIVPMADGFINAITRFLHQHCRFTIYDFRDLDGSQFGLPLEAGSGPTLSFRASMFFLKEKPVVSLMLKDVSRNEVIWTFEPCIVDDPDQYAMFLAKNGENLIETIGKHHPVLAPQSLYPWTGVAALFSLEKNRIEGVSRQLTYLLESDYSPILECLEWFISVFRLGEGFGKPSEFSEEKAKQLYLELSPQDPLHGLALSMLGYSVHMLLNDNDLARFCLVEAQKSSPNLALTYDHLAVVSLAMDKLEEADNYAKIAFHFGRFSRLRFTYETTKIMIALAQKNYEKANKYTRLTLLRKPNFLGATRFAAVTNVLSGSLSEAKFYVERAEELSPSFDLNQWSQSMIERFPGRLGVDVKDAVIKLREGGIYE